MLQIEWLEISISA